MELVSSMELPPSGARPPPSASPPAGAPAPPPPAASDARPPVVARKSPSGLTAPRQRHRRSHSDGSSGITDSLLSDPSIVAAAAAADAAELTTAEDLARAEAAAAVRPRKLPKRAPKAPWRKVLYEQQPYEDNYVDQAFLSKLITNQNVVILEYWEVVKGTYAITMQLSVVVMYALTCTARVSLPPSLPLSSPSSFPPVPGTFL